MQPNPRKSLLLVMIQMLALAVLVLTGPIFARALLFLALEMAGIALIVWALWSMRGSLPNVTPDVRRGVALVRHGPYRWIRHPMYTSLLMIGAALVLDELTALRAAAFLLLAADLVTKLNYEERLLADRFPEYTDYQQQSHRLIPYLY